MAADGDAAADDLLERIDDLRIASIRPLMPAACLVEELADSSVYETIRGARGALSSIARGRDPRLAVVVGPAAAHDPAAVLEFARRLKPVADSLRDELVLVVRVFLDEPAGGAGRWSGAMYDPGLDGSFQVNRGFRQARNLLLEIARLGLPAGCLYLDSISPQFIADLVSWSAIGSPTVSSSLHRQLASGLSTPVGFRGGAGHAVAAADTVRAAAAAHAFLSVSKQGVAGVVQTTGNRDTHVVLPPPGADGGAEAEAACAALAALDLPSSVMVDCGYGAGQETPAAMAGAAAAVVARVAGGDERVSGVLLSSFLEEGQQNIGHEPAKLRFGVSVTEPCLGWEQTLSLLNTLAAAVKKRQAAAPAALGRAPSLPRAAPSFRELGTLDTTDNLRVHTIRPLLSPACAIEQVPMSREAKRLVLRARCEISQIVQGESDRLLVLAGPPAVHDPSAAIEYAARLAALAAKHEGELVVVMQVNLSRSAEAEEGGWAGLVTDPTMNGSVSVNAGFRAARQLLLDIGSLGLPTSTEYVDTITPQFVADLVSHALVGARQACSRAHRELAFGLSTPVGFQSTSSTVLAAADAVRASSAAHAFLSVSKQGVAGICQTTGNRDGYMVVPPPADAQIEQQASDALESMGLPSRVLVDCTSLGGCQTPAQMAGAAAAAAARVTGGSNRVCGVLLGSFLLEGRQELTPGKALVRGMSVAEPCMDWSATEAAIEELATAVRVRRGEMPPLKKARAA